VTNLGLSQRLVAQQAGHPARALATGQLDEGLDTATRQAERNRGVARGKQQRPREDVQRPWLAQRRVRHQHRALGRDKDVVDGEVMGTRTAHPSDLPGVESLGLVDRHE
jgi:hypothetical protein